MGVMVQNKELLSQLRRALRYDPETGLFYWKVDIRRAFDKIPAGTLAGSTNKFGRVIIWFKGKEYLAHRLVWFMTHGSLPEQNIDHIDGNPANNRISNLRDVSSAVNNQNRRKPNKNNNSSKYLGVSWNKEKQKFVARITVNSKLKYLGSFDTEEQAWDSYLTAKRLLHEGCTC